MHLVLNFLLTVFMSLESTGTNMNCNALSGTIVTPVTLSATNNDEDDVQEEMDAFTEARPGFVV